MPNQQLDNSLTQGQLPPHPSRPRLWTILIVLGVVCAFALGFGMVRNNQQLAQTNDSDIPTPAPAQTTYGSGNGQPDLRETPQPIPVPTRTPVPYDASAVYAAAAPTPPPGPTYRPADQGEVVVYSDAGQPQGQQPTASLANDVQNALPPGAPPTNALAPAAAPPDVPPIARAAGATQQDQPFPVSMPHADSTPAPVNLSAGRRIMFQLTESVDTENPGLVTAVLINDACDQHNRAVAWGGGATLLGTTADATNSGRHANIHWFRLTQPDGTRITIEDTQTQDQGGHNGIVGIVNTHAWEQFRDTTLESIASGASSIISSALSHGSNLGIYAQPPNNVWHTYTTDHILPANTVFFVTLASDYEAGAPFNGEYCRSDNDLENSP